MRWMKWKRGNTKPVQLYDSYMTLKGWKWWMLPLGQFFSSLQHVVCVQTNRHTCLFPISFTQSASVCDLQWWAEIDCLPAISTDSFSPQAAQQPPLFLLKSPAPTSVTLGCWTRVLPQEPMCLSCFYITSLLFPPTVNGQHHKGLSFPKPVMWSRTRMGKMSRPRVPVFCQPPLTCISPCWCLYPSFRYLCPFKCFKPICLPACHVSHVLDSMLVFFFCKLQQMQVLHGAAVVVVIVVMLPCNALSHGC